MPLLMLVSPWLISAWVTWVEAFLSKGDHNRRKENCPASREFLQTFLGVKSLGANERVAYATLELLHPIYACTIERQDVATL